MSITITRGKETHGSMKRLIPAFGLLLGAALVAGSAFAAPKLTIPETDFDFGFAPSNAQVSHYFWLKSTGDDSLKILQVVPG